MRTHPAPFGLLKLAMIRSVFIASFLVLTLGLTSSLQAQALEDYTPPVDRITLKKRGKVLEGRIVLVTDEKIVLRQKSKHKEYDREDVESYVWSEEAHAELFPRLRKATDSTTADLQALSEEFGVAGLAGEAALCHWIVLAQDPANELSHEALGHRLKNKGWQVRIDGKWTNWDKLDDLTADWGKGWQFTTAHFDVRTNLPLNDALRVAEDAEILLRHFYNHYGKQLGLYIPTRRQELHVHGDHKSFPGGGAFTSLFSTSQERTTVDASASYWMGDLVQRLTQHLFYASSFETGAQSALPSWVHLGVYRNFAAMMNLTDREKGSLNWEPTRAHDEDREMHRTAKEPGDLNRLLTIDTSEIFTKRGELALAHASTLVDFCMRGEDRKHFEPFAEFVRSALAGKGSPTHFKKLLGIRKEKDFVAAWGRFVGRE